MCRCAHVPQENWVIGAKETGRSLRCGQRYNGCNYASGVRYPNSSPSSRSRDLNAVLVNFMLRIDFM